ncbi:EamA family transporter RarD [Pseudomonadales bacterium]|nr:EamA family transporter RarD [Pseudomonadales bacterium]
MFDQRTMHGAYFALAAYGFWGVAPIYFKLLSHVSPVEILCHRVIWSVFLLLGILAYTGQLAVLRVTRRQLGLCLVTAILLSINWLIFIDAIISNNIVEASLGYFINPLVNVFLGMLFLREYLRPLQWIAISIAALGIGFQVFTLGALPWVSLALAFSFGFYGLIRKTLQLHPVGGLAIETLMMLPPALACLAWFYSQGAVSFAHVDRSTDVLLMLGRLSLTAAGMFQYLAPSLTLVIAVVIFNEAFGIERLITFACIWVALLIFSIEALHHHRRINLRLKTNLL